VSKLLSLCAALAVCGLSSLAMAATTSTPATATINLDIEKYVAVVILPGPGTGGVYTAVYNTQGSAGTTASVTIPVELIANCPATASQSLSTPSNGLNATASPDSAFTGFTGTADTSASVTVTYTDLTNTTAAAAIASTTTLTVTVTAP